MEPIGADTIVDVLDAMDTERAALIALLNELEDDDWSRPTECPAYTVKGIASHVLGDDLSLLSRQRDGATQGLILMAEAMPGADFRALLDGFNDQWVEASRFFSPPVLIELLRLAGTWTADYYRAVDPDLDGEPVPMFRPTMDGPSPFWQAIAREYLERWAHHSQILRALGRPSLGDPALLETGVRIVASAAGAVPQPPTPTDPNWHIGPLTIGPPATTADILTLAHSDAEVRNLVQGPPEVVEEFAARVGRRSS